MPPPRFSPHRAQQLGIATWWRKGFFDRLNTPVITAIGSRSPFASPHSNSERVKVGVNQVSCLDNSNSNDIPA
jgi:hypothetical protein